MFYSQVLRSTAAAAARSQRGHAGRHLGQSWALTETRRLAPSLLGWTGALAVIIGWPAAFEYFSPHHNAVK